MIFQLLKNIKQLGLSHALSATMIVQGVGVQQMTIQEFEEQNLMEVFVENMAGRDSHLLSCLV